MMKHLESRNSPGCGEIGKKSECATEVVLIIFSLAHASLLIAKCRLSAGVQLLLPTVTMLGSWCGSFV